MLSSGRASCQAGPVLAGGRVQLACVAAGRPAGPRLVHAALFPPSRALPPLHVRRGASFRAAHSAAPLLGQLPETGGPNANADAKQTSRPAAGERPAAVRMSIMRR
jgi:hypothetical protein